MKKFIILIFIAGLIAGGYYYSQNYYQKETTKITNTEFQDVSIRLKWLHQTQFAGLYTADQKGYYKDAGLNVSLYPFRYETPPIDEVSAGTIDFGITGADELLVARAEGKKLVALAVIYQENPVVAYTLKTSGLTEPKHFIGKKLGIENNVNVELVTRAMLADQNVDYDNDVTIIPIDYDATPLIQGEVDIATGYVINEPLQAEEAGYPVNIIHPYKYGVSLYADVIFTTEDTIKNNPELVEKFIQATLKGWDYAIDHQDEAVKYTLMYKDEENIALNYNHQKKLLEKSVPLIKPTKATKIGQMNYVKWVRTYELLRKYEIIDKDLDVTKAYTTDFIK